ncbi:MAG: MotA/TolQ/ExbB proton channel family protein [Gammaproteobacteria bacterium]|nr:MotA/TolQ/ExbB proton channel family protein [Gammaproteobacteria bacterium]
MRISILFSFLLLSFISSNIQSDELEKAYTKEFAYLVAEKKALEQRLKELTKQQNENLKKVTAEIDGLQKVFLKKQNMTDRINRQIVDASRDVDHVENDSLLLDTTLSQATESLKKLNVKFDENIDYYKQLAHSFSQAKKIIINDGKINTSTAQYFMPNGEAVNGEIINVGRIAKYGNSEQGGGILAPVGNGQFRVWNDTTQLVAKQISDNFQPANIEMFLFDSIEKGIEKEDEKTFKDNVKASGTVGEVIITLGIVGIFLVLIRIFFLSKASSNIHKTVGTVNEKIENGDVNDAITACKKNASAVSNVIAATLRSLHKERDHIEDIISESILHESSRIDRFGAAILIIAAISPLLGLLGTVTGMISTFDIITEYGTGDPKLLSSGISEALLTTKYGLVVAIPLLVMGNLLSSWGQRIKNELEQAALHIINTHKI